MPGKAHNRPLFLGSEWREQNLSISRPQKYGGREMHPPVSRKRPPIHGGRMRDIAPRTRGEEDSRGGKTMPPRIILSKPHAKSS